MPPEKRNSLTAACVGSGESGDQASGNTRWFQRLLEELGHELVMGDAAQIRAMVVRRQKTDARDAGICWSYWSGNSFPGSGCRARRSRTCGSWCCIVTNW